MRLINVGRDLEMKGEKLPNGVVVEVSDKKGEYLKDVPDVHLVKDQRTKLKDRMIKESGNESENKKFKCDVCGKVFDKRIALAGHMRSHK